MIYVELAAYACTKESLESEIAAAGLVLREFPRDVTRFRTYFPTVKLVSPD